MSIRIGDKVRFLNDVGGGIVSAFAGKDQVVVEGDDGFGFPVHIRECVVISSSDLPAQGAATQKAELKTPVPSKTTQIYTSKVSRFDSSNEDDLNISLAYIPTNQADIQRTDFDAYLINSSDFSLYFTYLNKQEGRYICRHSSVIEPDSQLFIETFSKEELNNLEYICIQVVAFKRYKPFSLKSALSVELHLDTVKFYKRNYFTPNSYFADDAFIIPVVKHSKPEQTLVINPDELQKAIAQKKYIDSPVPQSVNKLKKVKSDVIEIDLHIHELLDSTAGMSSGDIFKYQLSTFCRILKEQEKNKKQKLVFIHGKGDGILRRALEKELRTNYKQHMYQDASFCEYGFGAIMVII